MTRLIRLAIGAAALATTVAAPSAQLAIPEIPFTASEILSMPAGTYLGEAAGVATNSKSDIYVYTRTGNPTVTIGTSRAVAHGGSRLFMCDKSG